MKRIILIAALLFSIPTILSTRQARADEEPAPGVARISLIHGDVSAMRGDSGDWVATTVNAPLVGGDKVTTGARSRTEIQLDYANVLRLDQRSEAKIADLTRTRIQIQLAQGVANFTVLKGTEADLEIDTPNMAVHPLGEGSYRIQVNSASDTEVTVRNGQAEVSTPQGSTTVEKNQVIYVKGTDNPEYQLAKAQRKDEWDDWNRDRDNAIKDAQSWRYTNQYYTGANDLDRNGHWVQVPDYDWCWTPYVNAGWVPYRDGRWLWEPYWGWTWVSYEPWGWAPYHYGRWFWWQNSWCWWPGYRSYGYYPAWAPAYVSFLGFGFGGRHWNFGFGFGFNSIGWLPLGPFDGVRPWWGRRNSFNVVNITNITNVTNINNINSRTIVRNPGRVFGSNLQAALTNERVRGALTTVSAQDFAGGRIPRNQRLMDGNTLRQASVVNGTLPVVPNRQSLQPVNRPVNRGALPSAGTNSERFFTRHPAPAGPTPFNERAAEIQRMVQTHNPMASGTAGTAVGRANVSGSGAIATPGANAGRLAGGAERQAVTPGAQVGASRTTPGGTAFGNGAHSQMLPRQGAAAPSSPAGERSGWQRFGAGRPAPSVGAGNVAQPNSARDRWPAAVNMPGSVQGQAANRQAVQPQSAPSTGMAQQGGWRRFGSQSVPAPSSGRVGPSAVAPSEAPAQRTFQARPVTPSGSAGTGNWQRFNAQPRPAPAQRAPAFNAPRSQAAPSGWNRFTPRPAGEAPARSGGWNAPAPRSWSGPATGGSGGYGRPQLELRKSITTPRAAPSYSGGGWNRGGSAPSGGGRTWSAPSGGGRGWSAPSGDGRSAPAPHGGGGGRAGGRR